jgi:hypothetical protein
VEAKSTATLGQVPCFAKLFDTHNQIKQISPSFTKLMSYEYCFAPCYNCLFSLLSSKKAVDAFIFEHDLSLPRR